MNMKRRLFLKGTLASTTIALAAGAGLITPQQLLAAWPESAFGAKSVDDAYSAIGGGARTPSDAVMIKAPQIAENGAVVPITVSSTLKGVTRIAILVEKNATPLVALYQLPTGTHPYVSTRIKMGKTSNVIAMIEAEGALYTAEKEVKVTIGGCGG
ncbi:MAG: thiosulfate oxidation carrier protein SoxY [Gammaproteobacteria bacterium]|nr:thiosulfate oxidation carrier protein SoxY [Gammaproteobacteria bacterium]